MNFLQMQENAVAQVVSLTQSDQLVNVNTEFVKRMINKGYHIIERSGLWKFSEAEADVATVVGQRTVTMPADFNIPIAVYSATLKDEITYHDEGQRFYSPSAQGTVTHYALWQDEFRVYPLPSSVETLTVRYYKTWADLVADGDEPVFPDTFHDLLVDYASYHLALRLPPSGDRFLPFSKAQPYLQAWESGLGFMLNSDHVLKTWDTVPNYDFEDHVLNPEFY